jgi:hypothetical protein
MKKLLSLLPQNLVLAALAVGLASGLPALAEVKLIAPAGYLPNVPALVRVEVRLPSGARDWNLWDAEATLSATSPASRCPPTASCCATAWEPPW